MRIYPISVADNWWTVGRNESRLFNLEVRIDLLISRWYSSRGDISWRSIENLGVLNNRFVLVCDSSTEHTPSPSRQGSNTKPLCLAVSTLPFSHWVGILWYIFFYFCQSVLLVNHHPMASVSICPHIRPN
ncbi:unnamed protein product [Heterobilharzia americana]|nr:unnamed protein product [Heterobilharzia americana]CAH8616704.1 unnamed protein product [Heterobilharzia americana]